MFGLHPVFILFSRWSKPHHPRPHIRVPSARRCNGGIASRFFIRQKNLYLDVLGLTCSPQIDVRWRSVTRRDGPTGALPYAYQLADEAPASLADRLSRRLSSHLVTKLHHAALVGFDLRQMEGDVSVEFLEEWDPITNQDRQDRITNFVG
jgi:hypothetical protein